MFTMRFKMEHTMVPFPPARLQIQWHEWPLFTIRFEHLLFLFFFALLIVIASLVRVARPAIWNVRHKNYIA